MWFCQQLDQILLMDRIFTFISDRHIGLLRVVASVFPISYHCYCIQHLKVNLKEKFCGSDKLLRVKVVGLFLDCVHALTEFLFESYMKEPKSVGGTKVERFLSYLPFHHWTNVHFKGNRYGDCSSNDAESFNSWIIEARQLPITDLVDKVRQ